YNTKLHTSNCIRSIVENTKGVTYEIILVDNASTDGSQDLFRNDNRIKFVENNENLGFGKANNIGYKYAIGKYIFLLNSDTILLNNALKHFYDFAECSVNNIVCLGSLLLDKNNQIMHSFGCFPTISNILLHLLSVYTSRLNLNLEFNETRYIRERPFEVDYVTGADLFIRREIIEIYGFFDPVFFLYYEETDLQYRYSKARCKMLVIDGPMIYHIDGGSSHKQKKVSAKQMIYITDGRFKYIRKHYNLFSYFFFIIIYFLLRLIPVAINNYSVSEKIRFLSFLIKD
ncbi:putative glycosyltransferase EpsH, partial [termite gut metagenome]